MYPVGRLAGHVESGDVAPSKDVSCLAEANLSSVVWWVLLLLGWVLWWVFRVLMWAVVWTTGVWTLWWVLWSPFQVGCSVLPRWRWCGVQ